MLKTAVVGFFLLVFSGLLAQETETPYQSKKIVVSKDTIALEKVSINRAFFKILDPRGQAIDSTFYSVNYQKGTLVFNPHFDSADTLTVRYLKFPDYLTKSYRLFEGIQIVPNQTYYGDLYRYSKDLATTAVPFSGLTTLGSISRGLTLGNNQNTVVTSNLDLQISGMLSSEVSIRASIQDTNIPLQEGGYSQKLDEFDQVFIELAAPNWKIRAGDLFLENRQSRFLNFTKKVQGIATEFAFGSPEKLTTVTASAALVRGQYAKSAFVGQEGNQGPYKLRGNNGELYVLVISGSERVYVNGLLLQRGENNQYVIDYNAGEIVFTSLYPITSEMRITIEYQYAERSYTRLITYGGVTHDRRTWQLGGYVYSENDIKNQPLQQNLSQEQVAILRNAGDDLNLRNAPSAYLDRFSENKILYKKTLVNGISVFEFSNNPDEELYNVRFSLVGNNNGNYLLVNQQAVGRIYEYVEPVGGIPQGNYEPIIRLVAPSKIQLATILGKFIPNEKTAVIFELGLSHNDKNLFSPLDDANNQGTAGRLETKQRLFSGNWNLDAFANFQFVARDFQTIERLFTIEFDRDWNLNNPSGHQQLFVSGFDLRHASRGFVRFQMERLAFSKQFSGIKHVLEGHYRYNKWSLQNFGSFMKSEGVLSNAEFLRNHAQARFHVAKNWIGSSYRMEAVKETIKATNSFSALSQNFNEFGLFAGRGDSTSVFVEIGYLQRANDSLQNNQIERVNQSHSYYLKSKLLQNEKSDLSVFANYRNLKYSDRSRRDENTINSRLLFNHRFFNQLLQSTTTYETSSGTIAQQEYTYVEVEPGLGVYTWNDYNGNGIQELEEFETAPFPDQARYIRVFLPNQVFVPTFQNKFSQALIFNPVAWQQETGLKKWLSLFYNQTSFLLDRKSRRIGGTTDWNPFSDDTMGVLGLNAAFRNSLFYNRGKQKHAVTYTFVNNQTKNWLAAGSQEQQNSSHQIHYAHLVDSSWLLSLQSKTLASTSKSENFALRNFELKGHQIVPKLSYLFSASTSWDLFYEYQVKSNQINDRENLKQQRLGTSFTYSGKKQFTLNGEVSLYSNAFTGNALSAVAFQMLEGLLPGKNQTWRLLAQKRLTQFLDLTINYQGRKSEMSKGNHIGNIQLRAYF